MSQPRVFLALPRYGDQVTFGSVWAALTQNQPLDQVAAFGRWEEPIRDAISETTADEPFDRLFERIRRRVYRAIADEGAPGLSLTVRDYISSVMCFTFNSLWSECLNAGPHDWFVMLHSDIVPHGPFVRILIEQATRYGFDVIHAPMPLKDVRGNTSTMGAFSSDPWELTRRLTVTELQELPETFGFEDLNEYLDFGCRYLLPNTGCMAVKLGPWARRFPGFDARCRVSVRFIDTGEVIPAEAVTVEQLARSHRHLAEMVAEDARFGFWCAQNGLKVGATCLVVANHHGLGQYPNNVAWGQPHDQAYFAARRPL